MENQKNNLFNTIKHKPFLICLFVIVIGVAALVFASLSKAIDNKIALIEAEKTTISQTTENVFEQPVIPENTLNIGTVKKYSDLIETVSVTKEANKIAVTLTFVDEAALLEEHYAQSAISVEVVPVFYFYINNGTQVELPGELRLLDDDKSIVYYLSEINDFSNVVALTDNETVTLDNIMEKDFNVYIRHKTRDGVGKTVVGTYAQTVEQFNSLHLPEIAMIVEKSEDIKLIKNVSTDEFIWLDIYFNDTETYNKYNSHLGSKFVSFGFEYGGKLFKWDFIVTEYDNLNMIRCKVDRISLAQLLKEMGEEDEITVKEFFEEYSISVWVSDYKTETDLFCINEKVEIREKLNKSTAFDE